MSTTRRFFDVSLTPVRMRLGRRAPVDGTRGDAGACGCGMAAVGVPDAYNEEAFRYFLDLERRRSEVLNRPFVLLLLDLKTLPMPDEAPPLSSEKLLWALSHFVRETDFIGWYRDGSIAGAVLTQHAEAEGKDVADAVSRRIHQVLDQRLTADLVRRVRVRIYQLPGADSHE